MNCSQSAELAVSLPKPKRFTVGFQYPRTQSNHGRIYLNGEHFANTWQQPEDWGNTSRQWVLNRDGKAFELGFPPNRGFFPTVEALLESLETWLMGKETFV